METTTFICIAFGLTGFFFWLQDRRRDALEARILARLNELEKKIQAK
jgi:hypothetical protein